MDILKKSEIFLVFGASQCYCSYEIPWFYGPTVITTNDDASQQCIVSCMDAAVRAGYIWGGVKTIAAAAVAVAACQGYPKCAEALNDFINSNGIKLLTDSGSKLLKEL